MGTDDSTKKNLTREAAVLTPTLVAALVLAAVADVAIGAALKKPARLGSGQAGLRDTEASKGWDRWAARLSRAD